MFNKKIRSRIFLYIGTITVIMLSLVSLIVYSVFSNVLTDSEIKNTIAKSNKTKQNLETILQLVKNTGRVISSDKEIIKALENNDTNAKDYEQLQNKMALKLQNIIMVQEYLSSIYIVGADKNYFTSNMSISESLLRERLGNVLKNKQTSNEEFYIEENISTYNSLRNFNGIWYLRNVFSVPDGKYLGTIVFDIDYTYLKESFVANSIENDEKSLVANSQGKIILSYPYNVELGTILESYPQLLNSDNQQINGEVFGKKSIIVSNNVGESGWKIINVISMDKINKYTKTLNTVMGYIALLFILLALTASWVLSNTLTKPIRGLNDKFKLVEKGDLTVSVNSKRSDEFGQLEQSFNRMVVKLNDLIQTVVEEQKKKSEIKFQMLQAQINPHFLYNTLDSIKWLATMQKASNITQMTSSLINLLKYNISNNELPVTLSDEMENVKNYVTIQKYRYGDLFDVEYNLDEGTLNCKVLKMLVQPLVENAIFHGFESTGDSGKITISSSIQDGNLVVEVNDNGVGTDANKLNESIKKGNVKGRFSGIGLNNIRERINLHFGEQYGIKFYSVLGEGTIVVLTLPLLKDKESI